MIRRFQALNFRCLRFVDVPLGERQVLVGPNGAGKSTLTGALGFLSDLVRNGPVAAVAERVGEFRDLVWERPAESPGFELAVELELPAEVREQLPPEKGYRTYRYEVALADGDCSAGIRAERGILEPMREPAGAVQDYLFPDLPEPPATILAPARPGARTVLSKSAGGADRFYVEQDPKGWVTEIALGAQRSALGGLPESTGRFPASTFARRALATGITRLGPRVAAMRGPCGPGVPDGELLETGSNLPWVVRRLRDEHREDFDEWLTLLRGSLPGLEDIHFARRSADRYGYLVLRYGSGLEIPSWLASGGTLRLVALTLPAFLPAAGGVLLVEEPERGIHPDALEALHASLFSMRGSQVIATTSSQALLDRLDPDEVLCLECGPDGATRVTRGPGATIESADDGETG
ncbi:MAG: AAA family ATPase [Gemmatimonadetes bacterium]|nr:AAA family ATPase [Gemmatimonadota bacterium]MYE70807.1 AAA family ATPase [Gemmatimonadota bacterium]MYJ68742.1 AAA family ATPase [Gemmatimonadota bacterium]